MKNIIFILTVVVLFGCCPNPPDCIDFTEENLQWNPYTNGQQVEYVNHTGDSLLTLDIAVEQFDYDVEVGCKKLITCDRIIEIKFFNQEQNLQTVRLKKRNAKRHNMNQAYKDFCLEFNDDLDDSDQFCASGTSYDIIFETEKIEINNIEYDVLSKRGYRFNSEIDTLYYDRFKGLVGFHVQNDTNWFYLNE